MTALCPKCSSKSGVIDSRANPAGVVRRRRHCIKCRHRWTTEEVLAGPRQPAKFAKKTIEATINILQRFIDDGQA